VFKGFVLAVEQVDFVIQRGQHLGYGFLFGEGWEGNIFFVNIISIYTRNRALIINVPIISSSGISGFHNQSKSDAIGVVTGRYGTIGKVFLSRKPF
jgi:hypothetical protein